MSNAHHGTLGYASLSSIIEIYHEIQDSVARSALVQPTPGSNLPLDTPVRVLPRFFKHIPLTRRGARYKRAAPRARGTPRRKKLLPARKKNGPLLLVFLPFPRALRTACSALAARHGVVKNERATTLPRVLSNFIWFGLSARFGLSRRYIFPTAPLAPARRWVL